MMVHCNSCSREISRQAKICPHCGQPDPYTDVDARLDIAIHQKVERDMARGATILLRAVAMGVIIGGGVGWAKGGGLGMLVGAFIGFIAGVVVAQVIEKMGNADAILLRGMLVGPVIGVALGSVSWANGHGLGELFLGAFVGLVVGAIVAWVIGFVRDMLF